MAQDLKYGRVNISASKIPTDEPIFILRAQDRLAEPLIRQYAEMLRYHYGDADIYHSALESADNFQQWHDKKMPD